MTFSEFAILIRDEMRNFNNWTVPKALVVSLLKQVRDQIFDKLEFS